jgi:bacterioferritin (cytochrome b1)
MRGDATVIQHLNAVLRNEMTAINQLLPSFADPGTLGSD